MMENAMQKKRMIGIDLGTTNSLGAVYRDGKVVLIPNRSGSFLTPSVVSLGEAGEILVGEEAKKRLASHPECTAYSFKRHIGTDKLYHLGGRAFTPEDLSSFVIRSILSDAREFLGEEMQEAIISVPAYFHDKQRVSTKRAGLLAGIPVRRLYNEPSAAALASFIEDLQERLYMVFDFGGGTLDISLVRCFGTIVEILAVAGDNQLGGIDFDRAMAEAFLREHGIPKEELSEGEMALLLQDAERCKCALSHEKSCLFSAFYKGQAYQSEYTNQRLMMESSRMLFRIKNLIGQAFRSASLQLGQIDAVVLAGGSSRMPLLRRFLRHLFGKTPLIGGNPEEMIARGLGNVCGIIGRDAEVRDFVLTDISPFTLGTSSFNESDVQRAYMSPILPRNCVLPASREITVTTVADNQSRVTVEVLQGEHPYAKDNLELGNLTVPVPPGPRGKEKIRVRFTYDINGILDVDVTVLSTGQCHNRIFAQGYEGEELRERLEKLQAYKVNPRDTEDNKAFLEKLQALYEESDTESQKRLLEILKNFEKALATQDPLAILKAREGAEAVVEELEAQNPFLSAPADILQFPSMDRFFDGEDEED